MIETSSGKHDINSNYHIVTDEYGQVSIVRKDIFEKNLKGLNNSWQLI